MDILSLRTPLKVISSVGDTHGLFGASFEAEKYELKVPLGKRFSGKLSINNRIKIGRIRWDLYLL